jgi:hypothetical protein
MPEDSTPTGTVNNPKSPGTSYDQELTRGALSNVRIPILNKNYSEDKLSEEDKELILPHMTGAFRTTPMERLL